MTKIQETAKRLYTLAEQADARLTATISARTGGKRDRWTLTAEDLKVPEIREAMRDKINAGDAWLTFLRVTREYRVICEVQPDGRIWVFEKRGGSAPTFRTRASGWDHIMEYYGGDVRMSVRVARKQRVHWSEQPEARPTNRKAVR